MLMFGILASAAALGAGLRAQPADQPQADAYPIIAELYDQPDRYSGETVAIYGLVIETMPDSSFLLQDVSQHPLRIVANGKIQAAAGDQLIVVGYLRARAADIYLDAEAVIKTQVVAGGGCC